MKMALPKYHMHTPYKPSITGLMFFTFLAFNLFRPPLSLADEVILTTGERFNSSKVWQESGKIRFNMHGLVVSVDQSDVARIITVDGVQILSATTDSRNKRPPSIAPQDEFKPQATLKEKQPDKAPPFLPPEPKSKLPQQASRPAKTKGIGHDGLYWRMPPKDISGLEMLEKDPAYGGIDQYWRPNEKMQIGQAILDGIVYGFWRNQLFSVMMWAEGQAGYKRLCKAVFNRYGQGRKSAKAPDRYIWSDPTTDRMLEFDSERNTGFFWMRSHKLDARIKKLYPDG